MDRIQSVLTASTVVLAEVWDVLQEREYVRREVVLDALVDW